MIAAVRVRLGQARLREAMRRRVREAAERRLEEGERQEAAGSTDTLSTVAAQPFEFLTKT